MAWVWNESYFHACFSSWKVFFWEASVISVHACNIFIIVIFLISGHNIWHNLRERSNLAYGLRGFSTWSAGFKAGTSGQKGTVEQSCLVHSHLEAEQRNSTREELTRDQMYNTQGQASMTHPEASCTNLQGVLNLVKLTYKDI